MVANCCICKSHPGQQEDVTFHKLPRNENLVNEWIKIISGIGIHIGKTATVCSKHFDDSQFQYKVVGGTVKRFLTTNAIPTKYFTAPPCPRQSSSNCDQETAGKGKDDTEDVMVQESVLLTELVNDETEDENSTLSKRKNDSEDISNRKRARVKTVRYIGDIGREDFVSDDAYHVVQRYVRDSKNEIKTLKQKVRRMETKINTLKDLTDNLRSNNMLTSQAAEYLQLPIKIDIIKHAREIDGKSTAVHAAILAPEDVKIYTYPEFPVFSKNERVVLIFPSQTASTVDELFTPEYRREIGSSIVDSENKFPVTRAVFIDSTWHQTKAIYKDQRLRDLPCVILKSRISQFWRHQKKSPRWYLATIEAIHQFMVELHECTFGIMDHYASIDVDARKGSAQLYNGEYDNLLYFFKYMYQKIHTIYDHEELWAYKRPLM